jgi:uncharacterized protein (TIGR04141 family)
MMLSLNGFLLRQSTTPATAWATAASAEVELFYWDNGRIEPLSLDEAEILEAAVAGDVVVALLKRLNSPTDWQEFIKTALGLVSFGTAHESLGAAVFCAVSASVEGGPVRWVAWTFGNASRALRRSAQDPRFGLLAALNLLVVPLLESGQSAGVPSQRRRGPRLREMRYRTTSPYVQQTGHRSARDIPVDGFRIDRTSDLIAAVGATGADPALTTSTLLGGRSLRFRAMVTRIDELVDLATIAVDRSSAIHYKEMFSWIDNIRPVDDPELIHKLRLQLIDELIAHPGSPAIDAILPDDLINMGEDRSIKYIVFPHERGIGQGRITLAVAAISDLLVQSKAADEPDKALDAELRFLDEAEERIGTATVLECLSANLTREGANFIIYDGDFYSVNQSFVRRIDQELSEVSLSSLDYPQYRGETEPAYNAMVGRDYPDKFVLLDREMIELPNEYGVEASDLVSSSGALIHVKRKGKPSVLSHLFLQVANSCELLRRSPLAWQQLAALIRQHAHNDQIVTSVEATYLQAEKDGSEIEVVFAFLGDWKGKTITNLPLFSRISMVNEIRRVSNLGFRPTVALISSR